jgi:hypothetical protein
MEHLEIWIIGLVIIPIIIFKYYQLRTASRESNCSIKMYLSVEYNMWTFISEAFIYVGSWIYLLIVVSGFGTDDIKYSSLTQLFPLVLVVLGIAVMVIINISKFKPSEIKRQLISEQQLEKKVANSKKALYFLFSAPVFVGFFITIELAFPNDDGDFIGFDISEIPTWRLSLIVAVWTVIYALMVTCAYYLRKMAEQMLNGNLYGKEPIKYLSISGNLLQAMAFVLMLYSFSEGLLTGEVDISYLLRPIFWIGYFLIFISLMLKYLSHVLQRAAILKEENDLTI